MKTEWTGISTTFASNVAAVGNAAEVNTLMEVYALSVPILRVIVGRKALPVATRKVANKFIREAVESRIKDTFEHEAVCGC